MEKNYTYEVCPHCHEEVQLDAELKVQTCPNCGKRIVTCSMCLASDTGENYCSHCCLEYQAGRENAMAQEEAEFKAVIAGKVAEDAGKALREPEKPVRYRWFAFSDDRAFEDWSDESFATKKECYEDMRQAVLHKMTWNTEYDEDFNDPWVGDVVYSVRFAQERIIHSSFSGCYLYRIVEDGEKPTWKDFFNEETLKELKGLGLTHMSADTDTDKPVVDDIVEYGSRYGLDALGYAFREMVKSGEISLSPEDAEHLWEYGGNTGNQL